MFFYKPQRNLATSWSQVAAKEFPDISHWAGLGKQSICTSWFWRVVSTEKKPFFGVISNPFWTLLQPRWEGALNKAFPFHSHCPHPVLTSPYCLKALQPEISKMYLLSSLIAVCKKTHKIVNTMVWTGTNHTQWQWFLWFYSPVIKTRRQMRKYMLQSNVCTCLSQLLFNWY